MAPTKVPVVITLRKNGARPPLYIAGTFSDPPWQPEEMSSTVAEDGQHVFEARLLASPGAQIQYKFKMAGGEWFLDEEADSVVDYRGFRNNSVDVPQIPTTTHQQPAVPGASSNSGGGSGPGASSDWLNDVDPFARWNKSKSVGHDWDTPHNRIPLFAHECLVPDDQSVASSCGVYSPTYLRNMSQLGFDHEPDNFELADPALEKFPSRLEEISELIHKVEEDLEEDETEFEGVPPSAVLGLPRSKTNDIVGEFVVGSPISSPIPARPSRRVDAVPRGSSHSDKSASLNSIAEGVEDDEAKKSVVLLSSPEWPAQNRDLHAWGEDDEAVVMSDSSGNGIDRRAPASGPRAAKALAPRRTILPSPGMGEDASPPFRDSTQVETT